MSWLVGLQGGGDKIMHSAEGTSKWKASKICCPGLSRGRTAFGVSFLQYRNLKPGFREYLGQRRKNDQASQPLISRWTPLSRWHPWNSWDLWDLYPPLIPSSP